MEEKLEAAVDMLLKANFKEEDPKRLGYNCDRLFFRQRNVGDGSVTQDRVEVWGLLDERKDILFAAVCAFGTQNINRPMLDLNTLSKGLAEV